MQVQADAACERLGDVARLDGAAGLVERDERRRTRGVHRHARSAQVVDVGQAVRGDAVGVARGERGVDHAQVFGHAVGIVGAGDAHIDAAVAAAQRRRLDPGALDCLPGHLQQHPLLRVHQGGFARRNAEEGGIESGDIAQRSRRACIRRAGMLAQGVVIGVGGPAVRVDLGDEVAAL
ncbi:hypothetical protein D3C72_1217330 [compost metagenome]